MNTRRCALSTPMLNFEKQNFSIFSSSSFQKMSLHWY